MSGLSFSDVEFVVAPQSAEEAAREAKAGVSRDRKMLDLASEIVLLARGSNTYGWDQGGPSVDAKAVVATGAKPISGRQWLDAMGLATELYSSSSRVRALGVPTAGAHPEGFPFLVWRSRDGARYFNLQLRTGASILLARNYRIAWERKDSRGLVRGESETVRDAVGALLSAFEQGA